jgi:hypothetical protein
VLYLALKELGNCSDRGIEHHHKIRGEPMARIIVTTDPTGRRDAPVLLEERVYPVHVASDHAAAQLIERLGWAINDAERTERAERAS